MKRLLLVEDDDLIRELYQRQFGKAGYVIDAAPDGRMGLEALAANSYDGVLLDIMMPVADGVSMLTTLRESEKDNKKPPVPVVMLTNLGEESVINRCEQLGINGFIIKARFVPRDMVKEVERLLNFNQSGG